MRLAWLEIDLDALTRNIAALRSILPPGTQMIAVVKANAYGHGQKEIAAHCLDFGVDALGVAMVEEGVELRESGIRGPLIVLGTTCAEQAPLIFEHDLIPSVGDPALAERLAAEARRRGRRVSIHLKVDTGMGRAGALPRDLPLLLDTVLGSENLWLDAVWSHLATADEADPDFAYQQFGRLCEALALAKRLFRRPIRAHLCNSAAILRFPEMHLEGVRPGLALYGIDPCPGLGRFQVELQPVMSLKAKVARIAQVGANTPLSYGRTHRTQRPTRIATLAVGYGDGYDRRLSNCGRVLFTYGRARGPAPTGGQGDPPLRAGPPREARVVGRVCMDQILVDVGHLPDLREGDVALLLGRCRETGQEIGAQEIAEAIGSISHEVLCQFTERLPRISVQRSAVSDQLTPMGTAER